MNGELLAAIHDPWRHSDRSQRRDIIWADIPLIGLSVTVIVDAVAGLGDRQARLRVAVQRAASADDPPRTLTPSLAF